MRKIIIKITGLTLITASISAYIPITTLPTANIIAYALSDDSISTLRLKSGEAGIGLYSSKNYKRENKVYQDDKVPELIYGRLTGKQSEFKIDSLETGAADTRVFIGASKQKLTSINDKISVASDSKETVFIRIYDSKKAADDEEIKEYKLIIERDESEEDIKYEEEEENQLDGAVGNVYLDRISLVNNGSKVDFVFDKNQTIYNLDVDENIGYLTVKAVPENDSDRVKVNSDTLDKKGDDKYKKDISLDKGRNVIKVSVIGDDYVKREYFLNINRGKSLVDNKENNAESKENSGDTAIETNNNKADTVLKNTFIPVSDTKNSDTKSESGNWCYRNSDGSLAKGWKMIKNEWYYFDETGAMKTGWIKATDGNWYYMQQDTGAMAKNTTVNGYKIGIDGTWIK